MMKRVVTALAGIGVLGAVLLGVLAAISPASAAPPAQTGTPPAQATPSAPQTAPQAPAVGAVIWTSGQITAIQGNGFTMQGRDQQVTTVTVDANTWIVVPKNNAAAQGAISDLAVGNTVSVGGVVSGANAIAARVVQAAGAGPAFGGRGGPGGPGGFGGRGGHGGPGGPAEHGLQGTLQSVSNGTLTVTPSKNSTNPLTVNTDASTVVLKNGLASVADLKAGDAVQIAAQHVMRQPGAAPPSTPPALTASIIYVPSGSDSLVSGEVQSVSGNTITLGGGRGNAATQVTVNASTTYRQLGAAGTAPTNAALGDLQAGTHVLIYGPQSGPASVVLIQPAPQKPQAPPSAPTDGGL